MGEDVDAEKALPEKEEEEEEEGPNETLKTG